jgi:hypothetical protein
LHYNANYVYDYKLYHPTDSANCQMTLLMITSLLVKNFQRLKATTA